MEQYNWKAISAAFEARALRERVVVLVAFAGLVVYVWLMLVLDPVSADQSGLNRQVTIANGKIIEESNRYLGIQTSYSNDPNASVRARLRGLQNATIEIDGQLNILYEQLILPKEMAEVLTSILQRETSLQLLGLENLPPETLLVANVSAAIPLVGEAALNVVAGAAAENAVQVFKHGLALHLKGEYLEIIRYLQSLEQLDSGFFWEELSFEAGEYPEGSVSFNIFTLSTHRGWIGV